MDNNIGISLKYNSSKNETIARIKVKNVSLKLFNKLMRHDLLRWLESNRLNYVFSFNGSIPECEKVLKDIWEDKK